MLQIVDAQWKDHLYSLDHLKEGIGLRGYGQRDPLVEYKKESFELFQAMKERVDEEIVRYLWWLRPVLNDEAAPVAAASGAAPRAADPQRPVGRVDVAPDRRAARPGADRPSPFGPAHDQQPAARRRRRRRGQDGAARRAEGRPQRSLPVRQRQEIQEVPRSRPHERTHAGQ